ncbi:hypothetical protein FDP41_007286 [Naegleria fowleri]|uniref:Uncharacterized protein n=1 Tax=Naegleria fowleri TaxID=5763 RepID=A0A6A5BLV8_NAEFO|nr:uncharacterized protein FDP41_007286 [Naegleria fowleri]KAF0973899.1 hypothetical protein FDP41_007286 [Naegleria fowleri]CAG4711680.1 unnamed protein product [Naegleria fowleri]
MKPTQPSSHYFFNNTVSLEEEQQPSTSSQPLSNYSFHIQESFKTFKLSRNSDVDENELLNDTDQQQDERSPLHDHDDLSDGNEEISLNMVDSDDGYLTPTEDSHRRLASSLRVVPEHEWVYSTPQRPRDELVCPGAPKRKKPNSNLYDDHLFGSSRHHSCAHSLPSESILFGPRGITKPRKHRKTSPSSNSRRRNSFPNVRLDFGENETNHDQGQMSSF